MRVAVVGGTGPFGRALAVRLHAAGDEVVIGSRDAARARECAEPLGVEGAANAEAVQGADLVVLAMNADAALPTARGLAGAIGSTPVLCVAAELAFGPGGVRPSGDGRSLAERVAEQLEGPVVAGLHTIAAAHLGEDEPPDEDALVCGDDEAAKKLALAVAARAVAGRALDAGPLAGARTLEGLTAVIVNVNKRYRVKAGVRLTGLE
jgi:8-hydroxy-5-deazaflavin:NADPH oxidoreductase